MNSVNERLRDEVILHAHKLARYEDHQRDELLKVLDQAHHDILDKIARTGGEWTKGWLTDMADTIQRVYSTAFDGMTGNLDTALRSLSEQESKWAANTLDDAIPIRVSVTMPGADQLWKAITTTPADRGHLLSELTTKWKQSTTDKITAAIRQGVVEGETVDQMTRRIRGTRANRYADGIMQTTRANAETIARTSVMHVSNQAQMATYRDNSDLVGSVQFVATLDTRTCEECGPLDGKTWGLDEAGLVVPPVHMNCRCLLIPVTKSWKELGINLDDITPASRASMDGVVPASMTYNEWLKAQPSDRQNEALGPRRAEQFRATGGITRFTKTETPTPIPSGAFKEQLTIQAAAKYSVDEGLAKEANFRGLSVEIANQINQALFDSVQKFPALKDTMEFVGSAQEHRSSYVQAVVESKMSDPLFRAVYPDEDVAMERATSLARKSIGRLNGNTLAYAMDGSKYLNGIAVNQNFFKTVSDIETLVKRNQDAGFWVKGGKGFEQIMTHEIGHKIDALASFSKSPVFQKILSDFGIVTPGTWQRIPQRDPAKRLDNILSTYGATNFQEVIAESWAEYVHSPFPRPFAKAVSEAMILEYNRSQGAGK